MSQVSRNALNHQAQVYPATVSRQPELFEQTPQDDSIFGGRSSYAQLMTAATQLSQASELVPVSRRNRRTLIHRFAKNAKLIRDVHSAIRKAHQTQKFVPIEADWITDNYFVIEEQLQEIANDLPPGYLDELPRVANGEPRVYQIAYQIVTRTGGAFDEDLLSGFMYQFQRESVLSIGEMWAFPIMLRLMLVEQLRRLVDQMQAAQQAHEYATQIVENFRRTGRLRIDPTRLIQVAPFVAEQAERNPDSSALKWIEELKSLLESNGWKLNDLLRLDNQRSASAQVQLSNVITSMRLMSALEWQNFFEEHCAAELELRNDPAKLYSAMTPATRNIYRSSVERISKRSKLTDLQVAKAAICLAEDPRLRSTTQAWSQANALTEDLDPVSPLESHVGYWLIDEGVDKLERQADYTPNFRQRRTALLRDHPYTTYFGSLLTIWIVLSALFIAALAPLGVTGIESILIAALGCFVLSELSLQISNWVLTLFLPPQLLPKLDIESAVPKSHPTIAIIPCMFGSTREVDVMMQRVENHFLSNSIEGLKYALLTDFADANTKTTEQDETILTLAKQRLAQLNQRYGDSFYVFHRERLYNPNEERWMGWERKRGKLMEFGRFLLGDPEVKFMLAEGNIAALEAFRDPKNQPFVITLDADTQLPHGTAEKLIGTLAHPLVRPVWDPTARRITRGYVVLQPRVSIDLKSRQASHFAALYSSGAGVNPYVTASSDVYQDLFNEGSFTGKGIYDLRAFENALHNAFPENTILSHDLIEGAHTRVAMASDIEVFDGYPSRYDGDAKRIHRWVRGDWQIAPWLFSSVPGEHARRANSINGLSKWKIFDNLRRSMIAPAIVAFAALVWIAAPSLALVALAVILATFFIPPTMHYMYGLPHCPRQIDWLDHVKTLSLSFGHNVMMALQELTFVAHKAHLMLDAFFRTVYRVFISHKHRLQWQTASAVEMSSKGSFANTTLYLLASPIIAIIILLLAPLSSLAFAWPILTLWLFAPLVAYSLSKPKKSRIAEVGELDSSYLRRLARRTWSYFEAYSTAESNFLPPDNVQEIPEARIAQRISPTNQGLYQLSAMAARDFGFISLHQLLEIWQRNWQSWTALETYKGHYYNWYDTHSLLPLSPRYISTVDSGNLAACWLAWHVALKETITQPILSPTVPQGICDTLECLIEDLRHFMFRDDPQAISSKGQDIVKKPSPLAALIQQSEVCCREIERTFELLPLEDGEAVRQPKHLPPLEQLQTYEAMFAEIRKVLFPLMEAIQSSLVVEWLTVKFDSFREVMSGFDEDCRLLRSVIEITPQLQTHPDSLSLQSLSDALGTACNMSNQSDASRDSVKRMLRDLNQMAQEADDYFNAMDFKFVFNKKRKLFTIGYNIETERKDRSHYDMLCSESRLGSYIAVGKGDVPVQHWFQLGRQTNHVANSIALLSWGGTMFEFLMPSLLQKHYERSLLTESANAAIERQKQYAKQRDVPWGISESAYSSINSMGDYQYQSFGVPGLGLKKGLANDLVIAPYATYLTLDLNARAATSNLRKLESVGALGNWGFYDAVDFTPARVPSDQSHIVVRNYMAHHHGMSILAVSNCVQNGRIQNLFSKHRISRSCELLLQEKFPTSVARVEDSSQDFDDLPPPNSDESMVVRRMETFDTLRPRTMLLSNGNYHLMVCHDGSSSSRWKDVDVTRYRGHSLDAPLGTYVYITDLDSKQHWSASYQPLKDSLDEASTTFAIDKVEFRSHYNNIETVMEVTVCPESDAEVRRVRITNHDAVERSIALTGYCEVSLCSAAADIAHPAFQKLFVSTEVLTDKMAVLAHRRPRGSNERDLWAAQVVSHDSVDTIDFDFDCSRETFIGRLQTLADPQALHEPTLRKNSGAVLDPIFGTRVSATIAAGQTITISLTTVIAQSKQHIDALIDTYGDYKAVQRAFELSWAYYPGTLKGLNISSRDAHMMQRLASYLLFPQARLVDSSEREEASNKQVGHKRDLWPLGISGDRPLISLRVSSEEEKSVVREYCRAKAYLASMGLPFDLLLINENAGSYIDEVNDMLLNQKAKLSSIDTEAGGLYIVASTALDDATLAALQTFCTIEAHAQRDSLSNFLERAMQIERTDQAERNALNLVPTAIHLPNPSSMSRTEALTRLTADNAKSNSIIATDSQNFSNANFDNGWGHFPSQTAGYQIDRSNPLPTPMPWSHVLANKDFGTLLTEAGGGYSWFGNSREFKISNWSNDPICDTPSERIWIRDKASGLTLDLLRDAETVDYRPGIASYKTLSKDLKLKTEIWVDLLAACKIVRIEFDNLANEQRTFSGTFLLDPVLGVSNDQTQRFLSINWMEDRSALLLQNLVHPQFENIIAFVHAGGQNISFTGNRMAFRNPAGTPLPLAMQVERLDRKVGSGPEICAALRSEIELPAASKGELYFIIGAAQSEDRIAEMIDALSDTYARDQSCQQAQAAWLKTTQPFVIATPNAAMNRLVNDWLLYQTIACRMLARTAFYQAGGAFGFRDQLQDSMAAVYSQPAMAREHILLAASRQFEDGDVQHWWHPPHNAGTRTRFSDDLLFLPYVAMHYVSVTSDQAIWKADTLFLNSPRLNKDEQERYETPQTSRRSATLLQHCIAAIDHSLRFGAHGLPLMGCGDWNDGMNKVGEQGRGESVWVAWFLIDILERFAVVLVSDASSSEFAAKHKHYVATAKKLRSAVEKYGYDGQWYRRAYFDDGTPMGAAGNSACQIDSLTQSWAALIGKDDERIEQAIQSAVDHLVNEQERMILLFEPPFENSEPDPGYINAYLPGVRENGGQYTHAAVWLVQAVAKLGDGNQAMKLFDFLNPILHSDDPKAAWKYKVEPYVMAADIYSNPQHVGRGGWTWYTGAAGWMYRLAIETLMGIKLEGHRICFKPCVPEEWNDFDITINSNETIELQHSVHFRFIRDANKTGELDKSQIVLKRGEWLDLKSVPANKTVLVQF